MVTLSGKLSVQSSQEDLPGCLVALCQKVSLRMRCCFGANYFVCSEQLYGVSNGWSPHTRHPALPSLPPTAICTKLFISYYFLCT